MANRLFKKKAFLVLGLIGILVTRRLYFRFANPNLTVTFFDVGQGDSALIQFPYGKTLLIDGGGGWKTNNMGLKILFPELTRLGVLTLDYLLLSHPDNDHARGLLGIAEWFTVKKLWLHHEWSRFPRRPLLEEIVNRFQFKNTKLDWLNQPLTQEISGVELQVIPLRGNPRQRNDQALVAYLRFGKCHILFTGDIEKEAEHELIHLSLGKAHVLKVAHHGSVTSSSWDFLRETKPQWAVVSVGAGNTYGHPRKEILSRYRALGVNLLRTDYHGAVRLTVTPQGKVFCESVMGECGVEYCEP